MDPCNEVLYNAKTHPKYVANLSLEELEATVKELKTQDKLKIPYRFGSFQQCPQFLVLVYMYKQRSVEREFIKIRPDGLYFHD